MVCLRRTSTRMAENKNNLFYMRFIEIVRFYRVAARSPTSHDRPQDHQAERTTLQQVRHDGILPSLDLQHIEPDLSIGGDGVGRIQGLVVLQMKNVFDLAADEQPPRRPELHHRESVALQQAEDVLFEDLLAAV